jgi:hypothetical protein
MHSAHVIVTFPTPLTAFILQHQSEMERNNE